MAEGIVAPGEGGGGRVANVDDLQATRFTDHIHITTAYRHPIGKADIVAPD